MLLRIKHSNDPMQCMKLLFKAQIVLKTICTSLMQTAALDFSPPHCPDFGDLPRHFADVLNGWPHRGHIESIGIQWYNTGQLLDQVT